MPALEQVRGHTRKMAKPGFYPGEVSQSYEIVEKCDESAKILYERTFTHVERLVSSNLDGASNGVTMTNSTLLAVPVTQTDTSG